MIRKMKHNGVKFFIEHKILRTQNFLLLVKFKFGNSIVKFLLVWLNQLIGMHPSLVRIKNCILQYKK